MAVAIQLHNSLLTFFQIFECLEIHHVQEWTLRNNLLTWLVECRHFGMFFEWFNKIVFNFFICTSFSIFDSGHKMRKLVHKLSTSDYASSYSYIALSHTSLWLSSIFSISTQSSSFWAQLRRPLITLDCNHIFWLLIWPSWAQCMALPGWSLVSIAFPLLD